MCLPTMTQAGRKHTMQCVRLVHTEALHIGPQRLLDKTEYLGRFFTSNIATSEAKEVVNIEK